MRKISKYIISLFLLLLFLLVGCTDTTSLSVDLELNRIIDDICTKYNLEEITDDIDLNYTSDYYLEWISSDPNVISTQGKVTRQEENTEVIITLIVSENDYHVEGSFACIVLSKQSDGYTYDLKNVKSYLNIKDLNQVKENLEYVNHLDVVAYIYYFHKLPSNYLTKNQAKSLGWKGSGNLWVNDKLKGKAIGGDTFKNYEQLLPLVDKNTYIEVDVNCSGGNRGKYRIVYNRYTFDIYYTDDHYNSFTYMIGVVK